MPAGLAGSGSFSLATYNLHNLFDTVDDPEAEDDVLAPAELEQKLDRLAVVIAALDADVLALQEVEHQSLLDALFTRAPLAGRGYAHRRLIEATHTRGIDVAVVSRLPLEYVITHQHDSWPDGDRSYYFNPDCLEVRFFVGEQRVVLLVNHLLSMRGGEAAEIVRQALARRLRWMVDGTKAVLPGAAVVVAGDLNDLPDSPTLAFARGEGPGALVDLTELVPAAARYTYTYFGERQVIDYLLVTPELAAAVVTGSTGILHTEASRQASDHSPVVTRFAW